MGGEQVVGADVPSDASKDAHTPNTFQRCSRTKGFDIARDALKAHLLQTMSLEHSMTGHSDTDSLKCIVCKNLPQDPLLLTCLHHVCKLCADRTALSVLCPDCQITTDCAAAPTDFVCSTALRRSLAAENRYVCGPCNDDEKPGKCAYSWCCDCQRSLCQDCDGEHRKQTRNHTLHVVDESISPLELYPVPSRMCNEHKDEKLNMACFTCCSAKCSVCAHTCYASVHDVVPFAHEKFTEHLAKWKADISDLLSSLSSSTVGLEANVNLPESIRESEKYAIQLLENAKKTAIDSLNRAYDNSRQSLLDSYDSLKTKAQALSKNSQTLKARAQRANAHWDMAQESDDFLGLFIQLSALKTSVQDLLDNVEQTVDPIDTSKLVYINVSLPDDLDAITSGWFGQVKLNENSLCLEKKMPPIEEYEDKFRRAAHVLPAFETVDATVKLHGSCCDVSVTDDGCLLLAKCSGHLLEYTASGEELSRWIPPKKRDGTEDAVASVVSLGNGRAAVGVTYERLVVLLKRVRGERGDAAWKEDRRLEQLRVTPWSLSVHGTVLAAADFNKNIVELISLSTGRKKSKREYEYLIQSVLVAEGLIVTASFSSLTINSDGQAHVVDAHNVASNDDSPLWRYALPSGEKAQDICADATGQVIYLAVGRTTNDSGRVTAVSALDGSELTREVLSSDGPLSPYKLSFSATPHQTLLAVLAYDSSTGEWGKIVTIYRSTAVLADSIARWRQKPAEDIEWPTTSQVTTVKTLHEKRNRTHKSV